MVRVAVFGGAALRRNLRKVGHQLSLEFWPARTAGKKSAHDLRGVAGALVELSAGAGGAALAALREALPGQPVGSLSLRCDADTLKRSVRLGFDFHLASWREGDPPEGEI